LGEPPTLAGDHAAIGANSVIVVANQNGTVSAVDADGARQVGDARRRQRPSAFRPIVDANGDSYIACAKPLP
jgi:hypothetical protein